MNVVKRIIPILLMTLIGCLVSCSSVKSYLRDTVIYGYAQEESDGMQVHYRSPRVKVEQAVVQQLKRAGVEETLPSILSATPEQAEQLAVLVRLADIPKVKGTTLFVAFKDDREAVRAHKFIAGVAKQLGEKELIMEREYHAPTSRTWNVTLSQLSAMGQRPASDLLTLTRLTEVRVNGFVVRITPTADGRGSRVEAEIDSEDYFSQVDSLLSGISRKLAAR